MKKYQYAGPIALFLLLIAVMTTADERAALRTDQDKSSYATGVKVIRMLKQQGGEINLDLVIQGMKDGLIDDHLTMNDADIRESIAGPLVQERQDSERMPEPAAVATAGTRNAERTAEAAAASMVPRSQDAPAGPGTAMVLRSQYAPGGGDPDAPSGVMLSRRNQAKLDVQRQKQMMRTQAVSGSGPN